MVLELKERPFSIRQRLVVRYHNHTDMLAHGRHDGESNNDVPRTVQRTGGNRDDKVLSNVAGIPELGCRWTCSSLLYSIMSGIRSCLPQNLEIVVVLNDIHMQENISNTI